MAINRKNRAFSFIELLIGLAVLSLLLAFCLGVSAKNQGRTHMMITAQRLVQVIQFTRNKALTGQVDLVLGAMQPGDWSQGVVVFKDNPNHSLSHPEDLIHEWRWFAAPLQIQWHGFRSPHYLIFTKNPATAAANGHFSLIYQGVEMGRVIVNRLGRISLSPFKAK